VTALRAAPARRGLLVGIGATLVSACSPASRGQAAPARIAPLKSVAPAPVGCAVTAERLADPAYAALIAGQFTQVTPEWQMKMEYIAQADGSLRFDAPDAIAAFAAQAGVRLFGHTLVWYAQAPLAFARLDGDAAAFGKAFDAYIAAVAGRYRQAPGWDVVNEAVAEDGAGLRDSLWSRNLGQVDYMRRAFDQAHLAAPGAVLLINDYNLESLPQKRATYLRLAETLLKAGAPLSGLGAQTHLAADLAPGAVTTAIAELGALGLPIHVSELDISLNRASAPFASREDLVQRQARLAGEVGEAFARLKPAQRFALTLWGLRDGDSWLRSPSENPNPPLDAPLFFDDAGQPKPLLGALERGLAS